MAGGACGEAAIPSRLLSGPALQPLCPRKLTAFLCLWRFAVPLGPRLGFAWVRVVWFPAPGFDSDPSLLFVSHALARGFRPASRSPVAMCQFRS